MCLFRLLYPTDTSAAAYMVSSGGAQTPSNMLTSPSTPSSFDNFTGMNFQNWLMALPSMSITIYACQLHMLVEELGEWPMTIFRANQTLITYEAGSRPLVLSTNKGMVHSFKPRHFQRYSQWMPTPVYSYETRTITKQSNVVTRLWSVIPQTFKCNWD